tara:strand:- start:575 stop:844 length:270 start_codon:yes stop_codon:yes gene_type:complete
VAHLFKVIHPKHPALKAGCFQRIILTRKTSKGKTKMVNVTVRDRTGGILAMFQFANMTHYFEYTATAQLVDGSFSEDEIYSIIVERETI